MCNLFCILQPSSLYNVFPFRPAAHFISSSSFTSYGSVLKMNVSNILEKHVDTDPQIYVYIYMWLVPESVSIKPPFTNSSPPFFFEMFPLNFTTQQRSLAASSQGTSTTSYGSLTPTAMVLWSTRSSLANKTPWTCAPLYIYIFMYIYYMNYIGCFLPLFTSCGVFDLVYSESLDDSHTIVVLFRQKPG